ncbi:hypothetical protein OIO90_004723 [Microbotryomycetes sp. JL221]|nr:hypothetical protein OIO90_004723 [Microbotryomycetes sp. JL221]
MDSVEMASSSNGDDRLDTPVDANVGSSTQSTGTNVPALPTPVDDGTEPGAATPLGPRWAATKSQAASAAGKAKKLRACNGCKMRRIKCDPVPPPGSCSRCKEKGIVCVTTPVIRKKPTGRSGKRIEEAKAIFGHADADSPDFMGPTNTPWITPQTQSGAGPTTSAAAYDSAAPSPINKGSAGSTSTSSMPPVRNPYQLSASSAAHLKSSTLSHQDIDHQLGLTQLSSELASHLLTLYQIVPQSWLPLYPRGRLLMMFESVGRRLDNLPPQAQVLAHTIIALTSRLSSHPAIVGAGPSSASPSSSSIAGVTVQAQTEDAPPIESITQDFIKENRDLRRFGHRREQIADKLRQKAVKLSWERGTLVQTNEETMACCFILEMLEGRKDARKGKPYGSAFVSHLRTLLDRNGEPGAPKVMNMSLGWSALIMREALYASNFGRTSHFTAVDDLLLCGQPPESIEETLLQNVDAVDVRDSITLFFRPMRPYTYHVARLARECSDKVYGTYARRQPLDEHYVSKFLTQLDHLSQLLEILTTRIDFVLSPLATSAHQLPKDFEKERQYIMRACLYTLRLAWSSLCLPLYLDVKRRVTLLSQEVEELKAQNKLLEEQQRQQARLQQDQIRQQEQQQGQMTTNSITSKLPIPSSIGTLPSLSSTTKLEDKRRTLERCRLLLDQIHATTLKAARIVAESVRNAPSLAFLTHLTQERLSSWVDILKDAPVKDGIGDLTTGLTREEKERNLIWMLDGFKTMGWSWTDDEAVIQSLEADLERFRMGEDTNVEPQPTSTRIDHGETPFNNHATGTTPTPLSTQPSFPVVSEPTPPSMHHFMSTAASTFPDPLSSFALSTNQPQIDFASFLNDSSAVQNVAAAFGITDVGAAAAAMGIHDFTSAAAAFSGSGLFDMASMFPSSQAGVHFGEGLAMDVTGGAQVSMSTMTTPFANTASAAAAPLNVPEPRQHLDSQDGYTGEGSTAGSAFDDDEDDWMNVAS